MPKENVKQYEYPILIKEQHLDTFGHVNNAAYLQLFEEARWEIIEQGGYGLERIQETRIGPTILDLKLKFRREIKNRQKIKILSRFYPYAGKVGKVEQQMYDESGALCCEAEFTFGLFDMKRRKLIKPTEEWLTSFS